MPMAIRSHRGVYLLVEPFTRRGMLSKICTVRINEKIGIYQDHL
jgi:hypothetical protein